MCSYVILSAQPPVVVPKEIQKQIPRGFIAMDCVQGDLNNDSLKDVILILKSIKEDISVEEDSSIDDINRPFLLYTAEKNKQWKLTARNDSIVKCKLCGGAFDPYEETTIEKGGRFTLSFYGGRSDRWSVVYHFKYSSTNNNWNLETIENSTYSTHDPDKTAKTITIGAEELVGKNIRNVRDDDGEEKNWVVVADKTFFYNQPSLAGKPRKGYLMKGDKVSSYNETVNFIQCYFTNDKGKDTEGFILKKDLKQAPKNDIN